jgi:RNA polymerase sigma factor (sigma-70 family)
MPEDQSFAELMAQLRAGDEAAACRVFSEYACRLVALARSRLGSRMRQKVDPEDVLQSVYKSFFSRHAQGQLAPQSWDSLWAVLTVITLRKCGRWVERFHTGMRDVDAEAPAVGGADESNSSWQAVAREPTPDEAAILTETVEQLLSELEGRERTIAMLALQGNTVPEIAAEIGRTRRTVQRVLSRVKEKLEQRAGETGQG